MRVLLARAGELEDVACALRVAWPHAEILHIQSRAQVLQAVESLAPSLIVIDTAGPGSDLRLVRELRQLTEAVIIVLTPQYEETGLLEAVEAGADDYMQRPVHPITFIARVRASLRRAGLSPDGGEAKVVSWGDLQMDPARFEARLGTHPLHLPAREFKILLQLARCGGRVVAHQTLSRLVWGEDADLYGAWLRKYIQHIRQKLAEVPSAGVTIVTVPKVGYKLDLDPGPTSGQLPLRREPRVR